MTERKCEARASARENDGEAAAAAKTADHKTYNEGDGQEEGEEEREGKGGDRASDKTHTERGDATRRSATKLRASEREVRFPTATATAR